MMRYTIWLCAALMLLVPLAAGSSWISFRNGTDNQGYADLEMPLDPMIAYKLEDSAMITATVVFDGDEGWYCTAAGRLVKFHVSNGTEVFNVSVGEGWIEASPYLTDDHLYIGSNDNWMYKVWRDNGTVVWAYETDGQIKSSAAVTDGMVYFGSYDNDVYCLYASNGTLVWNFTTCGYVHTSPAVSDGRVYFGSCDGNLYCLSAKGGKVIYNRTTEYVPSSPCVVDDLVVYGSFDSQVNAIDRIDGSVYWEFPVNSGVFSSPCTDGKRFFVGDDRGTFWAIDYDGNELWNISTNVSLKGSPSCNDTMVCFGNGAGDLYMVWSSNGTVAWKLELDGALEGSPALAPGRVIIGTDQNYVYGIGPMIDTEDPTLDVIAPVPDEVIEGTYIFRAEATDNVGVVDVTLSIDGGYERVFIKEEGTDDWTYPLFTDELDDGEHEVTVTAYDEEGNSVSETFTVEVDNDDGTTEGPFSVMLRAILIVGLALILLVCLAVAPRFLLKMRRPPRE